jgi:2-keto-4-pentenoate hydratase/2-oxohepta-3-ene-1,7-dioic acid hydratase in catechol pathway
MRVVRFVDAVPATPEKWLLPRWGILATDAVYPVNMSPYEGLARGERLTISGSPIAMDQIRLVAPITPSKVVCVGRNYAEHAAEFGNEAPPEPLIFLKPPTTIVGPGAPVIYPTLSERVDHEGELAVVIGRQCSHLREEDAAHVIFGYTLANDVTARDLQRKDGQWTRGKGFDTFGPVGPWIDTDFEPAGRTLRCSVDGELRQESSMDLMIHSVARILSYVTEFMTLVPGDIVMTGTPAGVGPVQPGNTMVVAIDGLGELSNPVVAAAGAGE